jgi:hypothetical protein
MKNVDAANEIRSQNSVSLNIETRRTEQARRRDDRLVRENDRRQANGEMLLEDNDELEGSEMPDVLLEQAAQIVTDYAAIPPKAPKTVVKASAPLN